MCGCFTGCDYQSAASEADKLRGRHNHSKLLRWTLCTNLFISLRSYCYTKCLVSRFCLHRCAWWMILVLKVLKYDIRALKSSNTSMRDYFFKSFRKVLCAYCAKCDKRFKSWENDATGGQLTLLKCFTERKMDVWCCDHGLPEAPWRTYSESQ